MYVPIYMLHKYNIYIFYFITIKICFITVNAVKISTSSFNIIHNSPHSPSTSFISRYPSAASRYNFGYNYEHVYGSQHGHSSPGSSYFGLFRPEPSGLLGTPASPKHQFAKLRSNLIPPNVQCGTAPLNCQQSRYRTFDGSCNNLQNPALGIANSRYSRLLSPRYGDGVQSPTTSITGAELPNARLVSLVVFGFQDVPDPQFTLFNMQWGQIMTHDMSMQAGGTQSKKPLTQCCTQDGKLLAKEQAPETCYAITIPPQDPVLAPAGVQCMEFVRTLTDRDLGCPGSGPQTPAEQLTTVTHYMDLSLVYGNTVEQNSVIREFTGGRMLVDVRNGHTWLPQTPNRTTDCDLVDPQEICYLGGDVRINQNPGLTILHTMLIREHNRIVDALSKLNPHYDDETLFQEARKINTAQYQHISYYEWLPIFLGPDNMLKNRLIYKTPADGSFINDYDPSIDSSTINSHATAAFRYFHSQIEGRLDLLSEIRTLQGSLRLSDWLNRPGIIEAGDNFDSLTRGHSTQPEQLTDINFDTEIRHFLFKRNMRFGSDLRAIDIQRNRDHGLASYNDFREFCGLRRANSWNDYLDLISPKSIEDLQSLYASHEDVEVTVGGSLETHVAGALAGPTFLCILTEQFYRTRVGDRFFYERGDKLTGFTREQLNEIRKASMARLLCDNSNHVHSIQSRAFETVSKTNPVVPCNEIPQVDLSKWKDYSYGLSHYAGPNNELFFNFKK